MTSTPLDLPEDEALAAEYVLGALDLAERTAAEARLKRDPAFAALVNDWQNRLSDLNDDYVEAEAPNLLPQIEARLFPQAAKPRRWFAWIGGALAENPMVGGAEMFPEKNIVENAVNSKDHTTLVAAVKAGNGKAMLKTVSGGTLTATSNGSAVMVMDESGGTANVSIADVIQSNGVIHVVDKVLLPK